MFKNSVETGVGFKTVGGMILLEGEPIGGKTVIIQVGEIPPGSLRIINYHPS